MIEGFLRGRGKPRAPASTLEVEEPQLQVPTKSPRVIVLVISGVLVLVTAGFGVRYYLARRTFLVAGEVLYRVDTRVQPVPAAHVHIYPNGPYPSHFSNYGLMIDGVYGQLREREYYLNYGPDFVHRMWPQGIYFDRLGLAPLTKQMDGFWWENERLNNCRWAPEKFNETVGKPEIANVMSNISGSFALRLKPGTYFIVVSGEVKTTMEDDWGHKKPETGSAFWVKPVTVSGDMDVELADADCSPQ